LAGCYPLHPAVSFKHSLHSLRPPRGGQAAALAGQRIDGSTSVTVVLSHPEVRAGCLLSRTTGSACLRSLAPSMRFVMRWTNYR